MLDQLAQRTLGHANADALVVASRERGLATRGAGGEAETRRRDETTVEVLAVRDGTVGAARTAQTDDEALRAVVREAEAAAVAAARAGRNGHPGLPEPRPARAHQGYDPHTAEAAAAGDALAPPLELPFAAAVSEVRLAMAATNGLEATDAVTAARLRVTVDGVGLEAASTAVHELDPDALLARAHRPAGDPVAPPSGPLPVVLAPEALAPLLQGVAEVAFDGQAHAEGRGPLAGRLGTPVAAPAISLSDTPRFGLTLPRARDAEGVPKAPLPLIQDGVAHRVVHDLRSGARAGTGSTGHATDPGAGAPPAPRNLVLIGGGARDEAELAAPVEHGLYVPNLERIRVDGERFEAVAAGALTIEDGAYARRVEPAPRLSGELFAPLRCAEALTARPQLVALSRAHGVVCPALRARALDVAPA